MSRVHTRGIAPLALAATLLLASAASAGPTERPRSQACANIEQGDRDVQVSWSAVRASSGCFFFSGPLDLGRDDHLGASARMSWGGADVTLAFGAHRFNGTVNGAAVQMSRRSHHQYGRRWTVTEDIRGVLAAMGSDDCTALLAQYHYSECEDGGACPGRCTIDATLRVTAQR